MIVVSIIHKGGEKNSLRKAQTHFLSIAIKIIMNVTIDKY